MFKKPARVAVGSVSLALFFSIGAVNCVAPPDEGDAEASSSGDAITVAKYEAESATFTAGRIVADGTASGGYILALYWNASVTKTISLGSPVDTIAIRARGTQCKGAPQLQVWVDGVERNVLSISSTSWTVYRVPAALSAGSHAIRLTFANDAVYAITEADGGTTRCDRNIYLDYAAFEANASDAGDGGTTTCSTNQACAAGQTCVSGVCTPTTSSDAGDGGTRTCSTNQACAAGQTCVSGVCTPTTSSDAGDGGTRTCSTNQACAAGQTCVSGVCTPTTSSDAGDGG